MSFLPASFCYFGCCTSVDKNDDGKPKVQITTINEEGTPLNAKSRSSRKSDKKKTEDKEGAGNEEKKEEATDEKKKDKKDKKEAVKESPEKAEPTPEPTPGPDAHEQRKKVHNKDERDFCKNRDLISKVLARLQGHEREKAEIVEDPVEEVAALGTSDKSLVLNFPITFGDAETLRGHYCANGADDSLSHGCVAQLVDQFTEHFSQARPHALVDLEEIEKNILIVGDTHGQLHDVLHIFNSNGAPAADNVYIFNGNICDRGPNSCEIFLLLFAYFLADPRSVIINRGNHEDEHMNSQDIEKGGGFHDEVVRKFGAAMYKKFVKMFKVLPLCTVVKKQLFVVHGGLATAADTPKWSLTLDFIRSIDHTEFSSPDMSSHVLQDIVWNDLLWSDPMDQQGSTPSQRGVGIHWGPDITSKFVADNPGITTIVRSHDLTKKKGHNSQHTGMVITVFSAADYCGAGNKGAVMKFSLGRWPMPEPLEFASLGLDKIAELIGEGKEAWAQEGDLQRKASQKTFEDQWWLQERNKLMVAVVEAKPKIRETFLRISSGLPLVPQNVWEDCITSGVGEEWHLEMAWKDWRFPMHGPNKLVNFVDFLRRFTVVIGNEDYMSFKFNAIARVFDAVLHEHASLNDMLKRFDKSGTGKVDMKSLREALSTFELGLSDAQMDSLLHIFFEEAEQEDGVPKIAVDAFLARFAIVHRQAEDAMQKGEQSEEERLAHEAMGKIGHAIALASIEDLEKAFEHNKKKKEEKKVEKKKKADVYGGGYSEAVKKHSEKESAALEALASATGGPPADEDKKEDKKEKKHKDKDKEKKEDKKEKKDKDKDKDKKDKGKDKKEKPCHKHDVGSKLRVKVERVFELIDADNDGFLETEEFVAGLLKVPGVKGMVLSDESMEDDKHIHRLAATLDKGGKISIMEFLGAFCFEDNDGITDALAEHMVEVLFRHRHILRAGCRYFDEGESGTVLKDEMLLVLQALNAEIQESGLHFTEAQMDDLCEGVSNEAAEGFEFPYQDFFSAFEIVDQENLAIGVKLESAKQEAEAENICASTTPTSKSKPTTPCSTKSRKSGKS